MGQTFDAKDFCVDVLWIQFNIYGHHPSGIEICDRANNDDKEALYYAKMIWEKKKDKD